MFMMFLYNIEYEIKSSGKIFTSKSVGISQDDVTNDLISIVGDISVINFYFITEIHHISNSIKRQIFDNMMKKEVNKKLGRPRKYDLF